ncbi:hypothetical protein SBRCBS47491_008073 [Sporothrix bragantina]|uniref:Uncharacterized protein n=1 Tax=Sporothrix bragantina TaxID=671064 RepID=A0ABP0CIT5_9PEZI
MGTEQETNAQPRGEEDDGEAPPTYHYTQAEPPAYNDDDAGEGPSGGPSENPSRVVSMLLPLSSSDDAGVGSAARFGPDDILPPIVLVLDGQAIYSANAAAASSSSDATAPNITTANPHLYEVNRGITSQTAATAVIEFSRMEPRSKTPVPRSRHIYNLHHPPPTMMRASGSVYPYDGCFIVPAAAPTRKRGPLGLRRRGLARVGPVSASMADHWTAQPVDLHGWAELGHPPFVADAPALWDVKQVSGGAVKWMDSMGKDVAMEFDSEEAEPGAGAGAGGDRGKNGLPRLIVTASLRREDMDTLVALWCCRLWEKAVYANRGQVVKTKALPTAVHGWKKFR